MIQPYEARRFKQRKLAKARAIEGDDVLRLLSASARLGDIYGMYTLVDCRLDVNRRPYRAQTSRCKLQAVLIICCGTSRGETFMDVNSRGKC
jgi:hypothetical protein